MADKYWVGGTGTWDPASTSWSTTSGGSPGAAAPLATDNAIFDANSGSGTVTIQDGPGGSGNSPECADLICTDFTGTLEYSGGGLNVNGNVTLSSGGDYTNLTFYVISPTVCTLTSAGKTVFEIVIDSGATVTLADDVSAIGSGIYVSGILNTDSYNVTTANFFVDPAGSVYMGYSTFNVSGGVTGWYVDSSSTIDAGYSIINLTAGLNFYGGGKTYHVLNIASTGITISDDNTFYTISNSTQPVTLTFTAGSTQTVALLYVSGTSGNLVTLNSSSSGTQFTFQATGLISVDYVSLQDSAATGGAIYYAGAHSTNVSNNSGWIFTAQPPVNRYWVGGAGEWNITNTTNWSATSGGAGGAYAPTSIDAVFFDANSGGGTVDIIDTVETGSLDFTGFTGTVQSNYYASPRLFGNLTLDAAVTYNLWFGAVGSTILTSNGATTSAQKPVITVFNGATLTLGDDISFYNILLSTGSTFNTNNHNVTTNYIYIPDSSTVNLGSSSITLCYFIVEAAATVNADTSTINMAYDVYQDPYDWEFYGGGHTYYNLNFSTDADTGDGYGGVYDSNTFHSITNSVQPINVLFYNGTTQTITGTFGVSGTAGNLATIRSSTSGAQFTLSKASGTVSVDYLSIQDSNATGGAAWYAGTNSTNVSNNSGWIFTAPPAPSAANSNFLLFF